MNAPHEVSLVTDDSRRAALLEGLAKILPDAALLWKPEDTAPYECDGLAAYRQLPVAVVLPDSEEQVCAILRLCHALQVPVVPRGAGTSLSGGAMPIATGLVLSLAKFKRIVGVDARARTAVVQPGVRNLAISEAAAPTASITHPTRPRRSPAPSAATSARTRAACIASSTASRCTTCCACARSRWPARWWSSAPRRPTRPGWTCWPR